MQRAARCALSAIAIADDNSVAGIVRAHTEAREIARAGQPNASALRIAAHGPIGPPAPDPATPDPHGPRTAPSHPRRPPGASPKPRIELTALPRRAAPGWAAPLPADLAPAACSAEKGTCRLHHRRPAGKRRPTWSPPGAPWPARAPGRTARRLGPWWPHPPQLIAPPSAGDMHASHVPGATTAQMTGPASTTLAEPRPPNSACPRIASATPMMHARAAAAASPTC